MTSCSVLPAVSYCRLFSFLKLMLGECGIFRDVSELQEGQQDRQGGAAAKSDPWVLQACWAPPMIAQGCNEV